MDVRIEATNGIREFKIAIDSPGVWCFAGRNGAGKTSAINATLAALGDPSARVEPSDGAPAGKVTCDGVTLRIGARRSRSGVPAVDLVAAAPIGKLIDPGIANTDAAARARIEALAQMVDLPTDDATLSSLAGGDPDLMATARAAKGSLLDRVEAVRLRAHALARESEDRVQKFLGASEALTEDTSIHDLVLEETAEQLRQRLSIATRKLAEDRIRAEGRSRLEQQQAQIRATLGKRPAIADAESAWKTAEQVANDLREQAAKAEVRRRELLLAHDTALAAAKAWDKAAEVLAQPIEGPTPADVAASEDYEKTLQDAIALAERVERGRAARKRMEDLRQQHDVADGKAGQYRKLASQLPNRLGEVLGKCGAGSLTVTAGRLMIVEGEHARDFETRASFGERVHAALVVALRSVESSGLRVLGLDASFWAALDEQHRKQVAEIATRCNVAMLVEEPDVGDLRVEKVEP